MDVFLMIRRKKLTIFTDAKDTTTVLELKKMIEGILKVTPPSQMLFNKDSQLMEDEKTLAEYGLTSATAKAQCPAPIGLAVRKENGEFEALDLTPYSSPPDLPDVMKSQEANGQEQELPESPEPQQEPPGEAGAPGSARRPGTVACTVHATMFRFKRAVWRWVL